MTFASTPRFRKYLADRQRNKGWSKERYRAIGALGINKQQEMKGPTSIERRVYGELIKLGWDFQQQALINGRFLVDAYVPALNLVIECDGEYWHSLERVRKKDKAENAYLTKCGYRVLRLSGSEIQSGSFVQRLEVF